MLTEKTKNEDDAYVYVTETGDVYHSSRTCYHIKLAITQIDKDLLKNPMKICCPANFAPVENIRMAAFILRRQEISIIIRLPVPD